MHLNLKHTNLDQSLKERRFQEFRFIPYYRNFIDFEHIRSDIKREIGNMIPTINMSLGKLHRGGK